VDFLRYIIDNGKVSMQEQNVSGIADWPPPENVAQVRSFIGCAIITEDSLTITLTFVHPSTNCYKRQKYGTGPLRDTQHSKSLKQLLSLNQFFSYLIIRNLF
jgi:hypothetical protein